MIIMFLGWEEDKLKNKIKIKPQIEPRPLIRLGLPVGFKGKRKRN
jgi:hypothetical protein